MIPAFTRHSSQDANIRSLFAAGEKGVWFDPSDLSTMYSDRAGTTLVTGVESPVGKILDKSGNGFHATASADANRPTLSARYNLLSDTETLATQSVTTVATTYTLKFTGTGTITLSGTKTGTYSQGTTTLSSVTDGTLTLTVSGTVTQADLRVSNHGANLPAYQRVTTSTDYDTVGFPKYLSFNGTSSQFGTSSINLSGTDSVTCCTAIRRLTTNGGQILEFSANSATNVGVFLQSFLSTSGVRFRSGGSLIRDNDQTTGVTSPATYVFTGIGKISTDTNLSRVNGAQVASSTLDQGTGNYGNFPLFIGGRNGSGGLGANLYSMIIRGTQATATQIALIELYSNIKTGKVY